MSQKLASYGQWTYRGAWALEIVASIIGLTTGLALGIQAFEASQSATAMDLALASAPFFMVSIAELTKIPIATLLFSASWLWKPVVLVFLLLLAGITFETVLLGLERAGTLRELQYEELNSKIKVLEEEVTNLNAYELEAHKTDEIAKARADLEEVNGLAAKARQEMQARIAEVDSELSATTVLSPDAARARDSMREKEQRRAELFAQRDKDITSAVEQFESQRDSYVERIKLAREVNDTTSAQRWEAELAKLANPRPKIETKYEPQVRSIEADISATRAEFERLRASSPAMTTEQRQRLQARRGELDALFDTVSADWERRIERSRVALATAQEAEGVQTELLTKNRARLDHVKSEITELEKQRIPLARTDQIRRLAARWEGKKPEEVTEAEAGVVAAIWFSSLAIIAGLAGPITAMVALALQRIAAGTEGPKGSRLSRLLRRMLLTWRWKRVRTVKVPVEIPVEREVEIEKRIEVPVEKIVKEILYVPVLTDDPAALRQALDNDLPAEVADLVKVSAKQGRKNAGST
ncbi:hypothetical protein EET67_24195 [Pseudaminobacter arsenicus]|uniref:Uncharacterized protein n=1 Tax=Borborobacter arsenicus TaxID=1851146 RepID=A0A432UZK9_9HYPH|nr:hypothetical protein [Pseudaminobacter arsenicus]RUM95278.1 hypothetical protein EET67_24195 [Pseudaminobacter arsenicus]